jgi:hypothetical protein
MHVELLPAGKLLANFKIFFQLVRTSMQTKWMQLISYPQIKISL